LRRLRNGTPDFVGSGAFQCDSLDTEKELVAVRFSSLIGDLLLNHIQNVHHSQTPERSSLSLSQPINRHEHWSIGINTRERSENASHVQNLRPSEIVHEEISIQRMVKDYGRDLVKYRLGGDSVVRRLDMGDIALKAQSIKKHGIEPEPGGITVGWPDDDLRAAMAAMKLPSNLEEDEFMGRNNRPIPMTEMEGLETFLMDSTFQPQVLGRISTLG